MTDEQNIQNIKNLKWLPFIGDNYNKSNLKVLVIGESHYHNPEIPSNNFENKLFTRWIINELALENRSYSDDTNFFKTINKMFSKDNPEKFWEKIVFYNFIQRAMAKNDKLNERPVKADYIIGWEVFFELISIVKPDVCLFLGSSMANYFNENVIKSDIEHIKVIREEKINATYFKQSKVKINGLETSLYFVKHPSKYFSANKWLKKLKEKNTELVKHLT